MRDPRVTWTWRTAKLRWRARVDLRCTLQSGAVALTTTAPCAYMCALSRRRRRTMKRRRRTTFTVSETDDDYTLRDDRESERGRGERERERGAGGKGESATARLMVLAREKRWNTGVGRSVGCKGVARERKPLAYTAVRDSELWASLPLSRHEKAAIGWDNTTVRLFVFRHSISHKGRLSAEVFGCRRRSSSGRNVCEEVAISVGFALGTVPEAAPGISSGVRSVFVSVIATRSPNVKDDAAFRRCRHDTR